MQRTPDFAIGSIYGTANCRSGRNVKAEIVIADTQLSAGVVEAIKGGRKIEAIKILREETGLGLANAKVLVDRAWRDHGPKRKLPSFEDTPTGPGAVTLVLFVSLAALAAWYFLTGA